MKLHRACLIMSIFIQLFLSLWILLADIDYFFMCYDYSECKVIVWMIWPWYESYIIDVIPSIPFITSLLRSLSLLICITIGFVQILATYFLIGFFHYYLCV